MQASLCCIWETGTGQVTLMHKIITHLSKIRVEMWKSESIRSIVDSRIECREVLAGPPAMSLGRCGNDFQYSCGAKCKIFQRPKC